MVQHWANGEQDDYDSGNFDVDTHIVQYFASVEAEVGEAICPGKRADEIEGQELFVRHLADAGNYWDEGSDDRHETGEYDSDRAMLVIKLFSANQVFLAEYTRIWFVKKLSTDAFAKKIPSTLAE